MRIDLDNSLHGEGAELLRYEDFHSEKYVRGSKSGPHLHIDKAAWRSPAPPIQEPCGAMSG